jgi:hypothetical protein
LLTGSFDWGNEAVAMPRNRLNVTCVFGRITESGAEFLDRSIQAVLEVHEGIGGPEAGAQLFAGHDFAWPF